MEKSWIAAEHGKTVGNALRGVPGSVDITRERDMSVVDAENYFPGTG
jgi:hypothetical protein